MTELLFIRASFDTAAERNFRREVPASLDTRVPHAESFDTGDIALDAYDGVLISGSAAAVYDDEAWIDEVKTLVQQAAADAIPVLGVCWGNQLVASALGGTVEQRASRELGYVSIDVVNDHPLFHGIDDTFTAFQSHTDYVVELPDDATLLAENDTAVQAFVHGSAMGVQFHPEVDYQSAKSLVAKYSEEDTVPANPDTALESWALSEESQDVLRNFVYRCVGDSSGGDQ